MPSIRPLPTVIGPTENALRALLTSTLSSTRIRTYPEWVVANAASNTGHAWHQTAADALKIGVEEIAQIVDGLRVAGLMDDEEALTDAGAAQLTEARSAVASTTSRLTDGIGDEDLETARLVLDRIRAHAEDLLRRDSPERANGVPPSHF